MRFGLSARLALLVHFIRYKLRVYKAVFFTSLSRYKVWMVDIRLHGLPWRPDYCGHFLAATSLGGHLPWRLLAATSCSDHNLAANLVIFCSGFSLSPGFAVMSTFLFFIWKTSKRHFGSGTFFLFPFNLESLKCDLLELGELFFHDPLKHLRNLLVDNIDRESWTSPILKCLLISRQYLLYLLYSVHTSLYSRVWWTDADPL